MDLLDAKVKGGEQFKKFVEERLVNQTVDFYDPIKRLRLGTFASMSENREGEDKHSSVELGVNLDKIDKKTSLGTLEAQFHEL